MVAGVLSFDSGESLLVLIVEEQTSLIPAKSSLVFWLIIAPHPASKLQIDFPLRVAYVKR